MVASQWNKLSNYLLALVAGLALLTGVVSFLRDVRDVRTEIESTFRSRSELLNKFVALHRDQVSVMSDLLAEHFNSSGAAAVVPSLRFRDHPDLGV